MAKLIRGLFKKQPQSTPDTTPPSSPTSLAVSLVGNVPHLTWTASTDNVVVAGYQIWRKTGVGGSYGTAPLGTTAGLTTYDDHAVSIGNTYFYKLAAFDNAAPPNVSSFSNEVSQAITSADVTAPTTPAQPGVATVDNTTNPPTYQATLPTTVDPNPLDGSPVSGMQDYLVYHDYPAANTLQATLSHPTVGAFADYTVGAAGAVSGADSGTVLSASGTGVTDPHLDTTDERFMHLAPVQGAGTSYVRFTAIANTTGDPYAKVGPEARADLSASAAYIQLVDFAANGLKIEYRPSAGGHAAAGVTLADPGFPRALRLVIDSTGLTQPQYSTDSTDGSNGTWTNLGAAIQMPFTTSYFAGRTAYPNIFGTGTGTISGTYSHAGFTAATSLAYKGTGAPGVTLNLTHKGRDKALNVSAASPARSITFASAANTKAALRMANSWIGGQVVPSYNSAALQTYLSKCSVVLLQWVPGWDSVGVSPHPISSIFASIKALATAAGRTPPKMGLYFGTTYMANPGIDTKLTTAFNSNFWWLYTSYHSGSIVTINGGQYRVSNINAGSQVDVGTGKNAQQWIVAYNNDWMINGGALGYATGPNVANPNLDFINWDDQYITLPGAGDWDRSGGSSGGDSGATAETALRTAYAAVANAHRAANGKLFAGNVSQVGAHLGTPASPEYVGLYDIGFMDQMIGSFNTYEFNSSIANFIKHYQLDATCVVASGDMCFGHININPADGSDALTLDSSNNVLTRSPAWQGYRHAIAAMGCIGNAIYQPTNFFGNNAEQPIIWPDCMAVNVANRQAYTCPNVDAGLGWTGPWVDPPQTVAWQNGIWRRRAQYCTVYWNPRGNGTRTVTFDSGTPLQAHYLGVQNPSYDNGQVITGITLNNRDGVILCNQ